MDVEDMDEYKQPDTEDKIKVTLSGNYEQFKAIKKTKKYKKMIKDGVKVVFKPKKLDVDVINEGKKETTSFREILGGLILKEKDQYLTNAYDFIVGEKLSFSNIK